MMITSQAMNRSPPKQRLIHHVRLTHLNMNEISHHFSRKNAWRVACILALTAFLWAVYIIPSHADEANWMYQIKPGDTISLLAKRYLNGTNRWRELQRINKLKNPRKVSVGSTIKIPYDAIKQQPVNATVIVVHGLVERQAGRNQTKTPLQKNDVISAGDRIISAKNAGATLVFVDGSIVRLMDDSVITIKILQGQQDAKLNTMQLQLEQGRVETHVMPLKGKSTRYEIMTPTAQMGVRGTDFRVQSNQQARLSTLEVLEGLVLVSNQLGAEKIPKNFGTLIVAGKPPLPPIALLASPKIANTTIDIAGQSSALVHWNTLPGASRYRAHLAADENFENVIADTVTATATADFGNLPPGTYHLRIRAINAQGLEGKNAAATLVVKPVAKAPSPTALPTLLPPTLSRYTLTFPWSETILGLGIRLQLALDSQFEQIVFDGYAARSPLTISRLDGTEYFVRAALVDANRSMGSFGVVYFLALPPSTQLPHWQSLPLLSAQ